LGRTNNPTSARRGDSLAYIRIWALWERGDKGVEEVSTEIRNQGARNGALSSVQVDG